MATYNSNTEKANLFASDHGIDVFKIDEGDHAKQLGTLVAMKMAINCLEVWTKLIGEFCD